MSFLKHSEERFLRYDFTATETYDLSVSLANHVQQKAGIEAQKKRAMSQFKSEMDSAEAQIESLSDKVASGYEMRSVDCKVLYHRPEQGKKTIIRSDNGQKIVENMNSEEWNLFNQEQAEKDESGATPAAPERKQLALENTSDADYAEVIEED